MAQSWDDVFKKQSKETANLDMCWINEHANEDKPIIEKKIVMYGGGGSGFAMPMAIIRK